MSLAVEGQAVWRGELAGGGALRAETAQVGAGGGELLHAMVGGADPEAILLVDTQSNGTRKVLGAAAEAAGFRAVVAPGEKVLALGRELLHAADRSFRGVDKPLAVNRDKVRPARARLRIFVAAELARLNAIFAPLQQKLALGSESLYAAIHLVGHVERAVPGDGD